MVGYVSPVCTCIRQLLESFYFLKDCLYKLKGSLRHTKFLENYAHISRVKLMFLFSIKKIVYIDLRALKDLLNFWTTKQTSAT